jgi:hypothetical protein
MRVGQKCCSVRSYHSQNFALRADKSKHIKAGEGSGESSTITLIKGAGREFAQGGHLSLQHTVCIRECAQCFQSFSKRIPLVGISSTSTLRSV